LKIPSAKADKNEPEMAFGATDRPQRQLLRATMANSDFKVDSNRGISLVAASASVDLQARQAG
jgi:hypothetical protein